MYLLIEKSTGVVADVQEQPFPVTSDFEWVEDNSVRDRTEVGKSTYNKQNKQFTERPRAEQPRDLVKEKLASLEAEIASIKGEPILGVSEQPTFNYLYLLAIPVVIGAYLLGKKL